ncbi:MAG: hypothetical protein IJV00_03060, partial [Clostridia bacterium]|nr:hypothetical protein [Clostridia bacterium]
ARKCAVFFLSPTAVSTVGCYADESAVDESCSLSRALRFGFALFRYAPTAPPKAATASLSKETTATAKKAG